MRGHYNIPKGHASGVSELIDRIIETDRSIENQLAEIERLLERGADAAMELSQLRELRQSCERLKELLAQHEKMPVGQVAASRQNDSR
jgi:DNA repair exonuclease SbcCD ATPase subunit